MNIVVKQFIHEPIRSSAFILILRLFLVMFMVDVSYSIAEIYFINLDVAFEMHRFIIYTMFVTHIPIVVEIAKQFQRTRRYAALR